jgi:hydroxymethylglutaryl-CoA reductase (NADPH)
MSTDYDRLHRYLDYLSEVHDEEDFMTRMRPHAGALPPEVPRGFDAGSVDARWRTIGGEERDRAVLADPGTMDEMDAYRANIENFVGTVKVPVGVMGPLRINGLFAHGDYYVPLATTEATLVASYNRGARLISAAGGCSTMLANEGVSRAPGFAFETVTEAAIFVIWAMRQRKKLTKLAQDTSSHGRVIDIRFNVEGNHVYFVFEFTTNDASGQNIVTMGSEAMYSYIRENCPIEPRFCFCESNLSGDKKATLQAFQSVRGRKVIAEVFIPRSQVESTLHTTPGKMARYASFATSASLINGTIGTQGQYANALAALFLACGQDVACVAESAVGITRLETTDAGDLHACVTLPNLMIATVGGGTHLPSQSACLRMLGVEGKGKAHVFAEIAAAVCLAGELSLVGAICADEFARAHMKFARESRNGGGSRDHE